MDLQTVVNARGVFAANMQQKIPVKTAFKIAQFLKDSAPDEEEYNKRVVSILETSGKKKNEQGQYIITDTANAEIVKLNASQAKAKPVSFTLEELDGLTFSTAEMLALGEIIDTKEGGQNDVNSERKA